MVSRGLGASPDLLVSVLCLFATPASSFTKADPARLVTWGTGSQHSKRGLPVLVNLPRSNNTDVNVSIRSPQRMQQGTQDHLFRDPLYTDEFRHPHFKESNPQKRQPSGDTAEEELHGFAQRMVCPAIAIFMVSILLGRMLDGHSVGNHIPATLASMLVSMVLGMSIRHMMNCGWITSQKFIVIDASVLNYFLLPMIIFQAGWSMPLEVFLPQFPYVLIFALLGTFISMFLIASTSWALSLAGWPSLHTWQANMAYASLISSTDPVSTLVVFTKLQLSHIQPMLNTLVLGESLLNDAVAIVMFKGFNMINEETGSHNFVQVITLFIGSVLWGVLLSSALILLMRFSRLSGESSSEVLYVFLSSFLIYSSAESLYLSGIIATLLAGVTFKIYGSKHLTKTGEKRTTKFLEVMGQFSDLAVFVMCGTSIALIRSWEGFSFGFMMVLQCLFARAIMIFICSNLTNCCKRWCGVKKERITWKQQVVMWAAGLRGGISLVLAMEIDIGWCNVSEKRKMINGTFIVICVLLLINGTTTRHLIERLDLHKAESTLSKPKQEDKTLPPLISWCHDCLHMLLVSSGTEQGEQDFPRLPTSSSSAHFDIS